MSRIYFFHIISLSFQRNYLGSVTYFAGKVDLIVIVKIKILYFYIIWRANRENQFNKKMYFISIIFKGG